MNKETKKILKKEMAENKVVVKKFADKNLISISEGCALKRFLDEQVKKINKI